MVLISVSMGECQSEDSFVCFGEKPTQKGLRTRFPTRSEDDKKNQGPRAVNRSRGKAMVRERRLLSEEWGPVNSEAKSANVRGWVSVLDGCVGISLWYTLAIAYRKTAESVKNVFLLALGANPSPSFLVLLFFHPLGCACCVLCACKAMWNAPSRRRQKPLDDRMAMSWFRRLS